MATHQALMGTSDEDFLQRMVSSHSERFGANFRHNRSSSIWGVVLACFCAISESVIRRLHSSDTM